MLWTHWDHSYVDILIIKVNLDNKAQSGTITKFVDYAGALSIKCPD